MSQKSLQRAKPKNLSDPKAIMGQKKNIEVTLTGT